eukprot:m.886487 g.886487  ORF g.886487 m.886487 type:complete len:347 (-) comp23625_c0_seq13:2324-3364(-)
MAAIPTPHFTPTTAETCNQHSLADDFDGQNVNLEAVLEEIQSKGYAVLRNFFTAKETHECISELKHDIAACSDPTPVAHTSGPPPYVDWDPTVTSGKLKPATREMGVRRLFHLATNNTYFRKLCLEDNRILGPPRAMFGNDLKLVQSMALLKPPGSAEKRWHQDQGVFRLHSSTHGHRCVLGWWIALDDTDADNGCMHFWPASQHNGIAKHELPVPSGPTAHIYYGVAAAPPPQETVCVPLQAGDAIVFDVSCIHGTPPNRTDSRRWALQMQYAPADARPTRCPRDGSVPVVAEVGTVFTADVTPARERVPFYDCEASPCVEPQYWAFRRAEAVVSGGSDCHPDCI